MKIAATIAKILAAVATVAGAVYLIATYGDQIVAWAKNLLARMRGKNEYVYANDDAYDATEEADFEA